MKLNNFLYAFSALTYACFAPSLLAQMGSPFGGFYFGLSAGGTSTSVLLSQEIQSSVFNSTVDQIITIEGPVSLKTDNSLKAAVYAGFGQSGSWGYLGTEFFADISRYKNHVGAEIDTFPGVDLIHPGNINYQTSTHTTLRSFQFGVDLRPGFLITPDSLLYGRVGVGYHKMKSDSLSITTGRLTIPSSFNLQLPLSNHKNRLSLRLGAGLEKAISPSFSFRLDYIFNYYGKLDLKGTVEFPNPSFTLDGFLENNTSVKIYNNTMMLGLSYLI